MSDSKTRVEKASLRVLKVHWDIEIDSVGYLPKGN